MNSTPNLTTVSLVPQYLFRHSNYEHLRHGIFLPGGIWDGKSDWSRDQALRALALALKMQLSPALTVKRTHKSDG
jgi:hypothetical protein